MPKLIRTGDVLHILVRAMNETANNDVKTAFKALGNRVYHLDGVTDETPHWATEMAYRTGFKDAIEHYTPHCDELPHNDSKVVVYRKGVGYVFCEYKDESFTDGEEIPAEEIICWSYCDE